MVDSHVNDVARAAYAKWLFDGATIEQMREGFDSMCPSPASTVSVEPTSIGGVPAKWVVGPQAGATVIMHLHAGGYLIGSSESHRDLAARLGEAAGARVLVPDYRLAPENPYPAAFEDALAVYHALLEEEGVRPENLVVSGDSAGGGLALALVVALRDAGVPLPAALVLMSPFADLTLSGDSIDAHAGIDVLASRAVLAAQADAYLGDNDRATPGASPVFSDLANLPPMLVQVGSTEVLVDDAIRIVNKALNAGGDATLQISYEMFHVFQMFADEIPEAAAALGRVGAFVRQWTVASAAVPA